MTDKIRMPLLVLLLSLCSSCAGGFSGRTSGTALPYTLEPDGFNEVKHMTGLIYDVSPKPGQLKGETGIIISAPDRVTVRVKKNEKNNPLSAPVPYSMYYALDYPDINMLGGHSLILVNNGTGERYEGKASAVVEGKTVMSMPSLDENDAVQRQGGWLSYHLTRYMDVPAVSASYTFWIKVGKSESNKRTIEVLVLDK